MVVTVVRERSDIICLHRRMLDHLAQGNAAELKSTMDELLDYLLQKFEQASARRS
jgi:DNA-binding FadR family transcriptional regulator